MSVIERFRRRDFGHMDVQVTIDDPKTYTKPFTSDLIESFCNEDEKDMAHMANK